MGPELTFTAVPGGIADRDPVLSVLVTMRFDGPDTVTGPYGAIATDWPAVLADTTFVVVAGDGRQAEPTVVSDPADSALWQAVLPADTPVQPATREQYTTFDILSYPVANLADLLTSTLLGAAAAGEEEADLDLLRRGVLGDIAGFGTTGGNRAADLARDLAVRRGRPDPDGSGRRLRANLPGDPDPAHDVAQLTEFLAPPPGGVGDLPPLATPEVDVHRILASAAAHPALLRRLGLIVDLRLSSDLLGTPERVRVVPTLPSDIPVAAVLRPWTALTPAFRALPRDPAEGDGLRLPLDDVTRYAVVGIDVPNGAMRYRDLGSNLSLSVRKASPLRGRASTLPALRSDGLQLVRTGAAVATARRQDRMAALLAGGLDAALLHAEDLRRGVRVDVRAEDDGRWRSLHLRDVGIEVDGYGPIRLERQEGAVTTGATRKPREDGRLYLTEVLAQWRGWSLSAPQPGDPLAAVGDGVVAEGDPSLNAPLQGRGVRITTRASAGTLPTLRFGRRYSFRARTADLVGGGLPPETRDAQHATAPVPYLRWDPVGAPAILPQAVRDEGGSLTRIVLRSDVDQRPGAAPPDPAVADFTYPPTTQRWIAAPKASPDLAEAHGRFDLPDGRVDPGARDLIAARADAVLGDVPGALLDPANYFRPYYPGPDGGEGEAGPALPVGYLPDPLAGGLAVRGLPGVEGALVIPFTGDGWPDSLPVRLVVRDGAEEVTHLVRQGEGERLLVVSLPQAARLDLRISCALPEGLSDDLLGRGGSDLPDGLPLLGVWQRLPEVDPEAHDPARTALAATGGYWALTPRTGLHLVHAVRRPLRAPELEDVVPRRAVGAADVVLDGAFLVNLPSTGRLDLHARWSDPVDLGTGRGAPAPDPVPLSTRDVLEGRVEARTAEVQVPLDLAGPADPDDRYALQVSHHLGDTRARTVVYTPEATSSFTEYFTSRVQVPLAGTAPVVVSPGGFRVGTDNLHDVPPPPAPGASPTAPATRWERDVDYVADPAAGTVARTPGSRIPDGAVVDAEFLRDPVTRTGPARVIEVPASARPAAPTVVGVLPAFRWTAPQPRASVREGGLVRVWLDRPWFDSGVGERLAVVCARVPAEAAGLADAVTRWGADPITRSTTPTTTAPGRAAFPLAASVAQDVPLPDGSGLVDVAVHDVEFSPTRGLWFADVKVQVPESSWMPLVSLAVARYQGEALRDPDLRLSPVVRCDQVQVLPERRCVVTVRGLQVDVALSGPVPRLQGQPTTTVEAFLETRPTQSTDDPASWTPVPGVKARTVLAGGSIGPRTGTLLGPSARTAVRRRLVVEERERLPAGSEGGGADAGVDRVVYTDTIDLDG